MAAGLYLNGKWQDGAGDRFQKTNPADGSTSWEGNAADASQVADAIAAATTAQLNWRKMPHSYRLDIMEKYAVEIGSRKDRIANAISTDMGKAHWDALGEAGAMQAKVAISIKAQHERAGTKYVDAAFGSQHLVHRPHGVMAVFGPFNFPGHLPNELIVEAFEAAGLPENLLTVVHGGRETGATLLNANINGLLFTGSAKTGLLFHRHFAGRPDVILALEMGGNNPLIVWNPADIDAAADIAAQSSFLTTGQRCSCARRVIIPEGAWGDKVVDAIVDRARNLQIGSHEEENVFMGPLVSEVAADAAIEFQMNLSKTGAKSLRRLKRLERGGGFVSAGVIDVTNAKNIVDEELFGPLMQIIRVGRFDEAITRANETKYGLSAGLVSDDDALWIESTQELRAGILNRNRPTAGASGAFPFGGPGVSGNFRPGAYYAADYCAWPQASQVADKAERLNAIGFRK